MPRSTTPHWLVHGDRVLASAEVARTSAERRRGVRGRDALDGVFVLAASSVHTFGVGFPIDVAFCDDDFVVRDIVTMRPGRVSRPRFGARQVVEAPAGSFGSWGIAPGDQLEVR